ncbi:16S rRNA (guanine(966)-N(2))-methyltransferase RsmD [Microbacterium sp. YY-01]|uniref:16S rRNA (guanine(966)-N(2))-methyltransferase RsmD n=1 Tax=Microbacterium sp. YY-01 TaxID=3421634 RepID=UPI003D16AC57
MTRIIAGRAGGIRLRVPKAGTRPTSDRVRESLFASLETENIIDGARVLDLYAGSGALALETLSRGAASIDMVEKARAAAGIARENMRLVTRALQAPDAAHVHESSVRGFLGRATGPYDLVFCDPPYDISDTDLAGDLVALSPLLSPDALVIIERASRAAEPEWDAAGLEKYRHRSYGDTALWWAQPRVDAVLPVDSVLPVDPVLPVDSADSASR